MELSSGVELVWSLAGHETVSAKMQEVEPEHFFCALLKFSELDDDDLQKVASSQSIAKAWIVERDKVQAILKDHSLSSARVRHDLRRVMGRGNHEHTGGSIHRSDASRQLFEQATRLARQDASALEVCHLLRALLASPTPAMLKAMGQVKAPAEETRAESPSVRQYLHDMAQEANPEVTAVCAPQIHVLKWAIQSDDPAPILLVCEPPVSVASLVGCAVQELAGQRRVARCDHAAMRRDAADDEAWADQLAELLRDVADPDKLALFLEATRQTTDDVARLVSTLKSAADGGPRIILAVNPSVHLDMTEADADWDGAFRVIWLHELQDVKLVEL